MVEARRGVGLQAILAWSVTGLLVTAPIWLTVGVRGLALGLLRDDRARGRFPNAGSGDTFLQAVGVPKSGVWKTSPPESTRRAFDPVF